MTKMLEEVTLEEFWQLFLQQCPPPKEIQPDDLELAKTLYLSGFGGMLALAMRLEQETPERRASIHKILNAQLIQPVLNDANMKWAN